ncbi:MAG: hypothetical protein LBI49_05955 [Nocardiopsaceae bacterium]|nr:hypothetical protein [Nocardiopsaceae bacterium]
MGAARSLLRWARERSPRHEMVRLITRMLVAQALASALIGLLFGRRHVSSVLITLAFVAAICGLAVLARVGTHAAWLIAITFEAAFFVYGLSAFVFTRYLGGTLLSLITLGTLLHPSVAGAFTSVPGGAAAPAPGELRAQEGLGEAADELGSRALG